MLVSSILITVGKLDHLTDDEITRLGVSVHRDLEAYVKPKFVRKIKFFARTGTVLFAIGVIAAITTMAIEKY